MSPILARSLALTAALLAAGCTPPTPDNSALELRLTELEERLAELQERLASVPDAEGLESASPEELVARLGRPDAVTRYRAVKELSRRSPQEVGLLLLEVIGGDGEREREGAAAVFALDPWPDHAADLLRLHAEEKEPKVRALLALAVGRAGGPGIAEPLMADLTHRSRTVRLAAVQALDRAQAVEAAGRLLVAALDEDVHVASAARGVLVRLPEQSFHFVRSEWEWLDPRDRVAAVELIGTLEGAGAERFLRQRLEDPAPRVALAAALELGRRGDDAGRELALQRLGSEDPLVARAARLALDAIGR